MKIHTKHDALVSDWLLKKPINLSWNQVKYVLPRRQKKNPVDFDDELKIEDVRYDNMTKITIKVQLF